MIEEKQNPTTVLTNRAIGIDLFKILCCFLITTIHMFEYSGFLYIGEISPANAGFVSLIMAINRIGTSGFVFISGYYLSTKGTMHTIKKIVSFLLEINFFSVSILFVSLIFAFPADSETVLKSVFPILTQHYWYPFNYLILLMFSPYLNHLIQTFSKNTYLSFLVLLACVCCIFLKVNPYYISSVFLGHFSHSFLWWMLLYLTAGYIRKYNVTGNCYVWLAIFGACAIMGAVYITLLTKAPSLKLFELNDDNAILTYCGTIALFLFLRTAKFHWEKQPRACCVILFPPPL